MKTLFKFKEKKQIKTTSELIAEIHETFNTEVDNLLKEAGILEIMPDVNSELISKAERLRSLGFIRTKETEIAKLEESKLNLVANRNSEKNELKKTIEYFTNKYPLYKFITEDSVNKICDKYNLVYSDVSDYIGTVPDKNLKEIENFKIDEIDELWIEICHSRSYASNTTAREMSKENADRNKGIRNDNYYVQYKKSNLQIVAPLKDFNTKNMVVSKFKLENKIEIPDPVVLQPVYYNYKKHYLVVTAWGDEASDELVVNQKFN